ncbi:MAG: PucR family transcriptional regulator, partial [Gaiellales bacterium]
AAAAARYLANRRQVVLRTPLPGGGAVAILGDPPATELERVATTRVAALLALELGRQADGGRGSGDRAAGDVMPGDGPPWVVLMGRQLVSGAEAGLDERERLRARIARLAPGRRLRLRGDAGSLELRLVAATSAADPLGLVIAARVADAADRAIAASRPFQLTDDRPLAEQEARSTLEAVEPDSEAGRSGRVLRADRLPAYRLLGSLHNVPDGLRQARLLLAPVLVGRAATQRERLATLRAVLERPGLAEAATALGIHRNTLAYRIGRIEASTGWRLDDPELRFVLVMAIRLVQDAQDASGA